MAGAAYLCAGAAYRSGAGLVRILTPEENRVILQTLLPEAVMTTFEQNELEALDNMLEEALSWATVAAIGPGAGKKAMGISHGEADASEISRTFGDRCRCA